MQTGSRIKETRRAIPIGIRTILAKPKAAKRANEVASTKNNLLKDKCILVVNEKVIAYIK
ncbi:hypothetical protein GCM10011506_16040 [Marivirga lumbricoides]|uniref:Uncharacterized protein n=1 Tax=Marivirga lumbricoides TaxID=1046115 RepID=A0ABQ1LZZ6_9BACT|nr:hypothetical protein GCM10011506_16040 [Marivirga lumbricoides]